MSFSAMSRKNPWFEQICVVDGFRGCSGDKAVLLCDNYCGKYVNSFRKALEEAPFETEKQLK